MASYDKTKNEDYTLAVQSALQALGANLGSAGIDGKWGDYTEAAYQRNKDAVDALVSGMGAGGGYYAQFEPVQIEVPEQKDFSEWLSLGDALFAAQAEAQKRSAQRQLEYGKEEVERGRVQSAATLETAANARGFGRSSYTTDMLQRNEDTAQRNQTLLINNFNDALLAIEADRAANAATYAGKMWSVQQDAVNDALKFNAQMRSDANIRNWEAQQSYRESMSKLYADAVKSRSSGSGRRSSSSSKKKEETAQSVGSGVIARGISAIKSGLNRSRAAAGMK